MDKDVLICTDSRSALDALLQFRDTTRMTVNIKQQIMNHNGKRTIRFRWVRGHSGVVSNDKADELAKEAANKAGIDYDVLPAAYIKKTIRDYINDKWQVRWTESNKDRFTYGILPNIQELLRDLQWLRNDFISTQVLSGHAKCNTYFKKVNRSTSEECECGDNSQTVEHLLLKCPKYAILRNELECLFNKDNPNLTMDIYNLIRTRSVLPVLSRISKVIFKISNTTTG
ncbi:uncharacterized protein [Centruroides vittatus]|uniref:uncharacterized protein n=1 Tax=Centruroides vittatus TaxID=120091 RepID=UPI0035108F99